MVRFKEPFNGFSHLAGAVLSVAGLIALIYQAIKYFGPIHIVSFSVYGASLILLFTASSVYHLVPASGKTVKTLRIIDHMMIYVLIAGSYTPLCLISLRGKLGIGLLIAVWTIAFIGIATTGLSLKAPRWVAPLIYSAMGWLSVIAIPALIPAITLKGFAWLMAEGLFYSVGAVIYGTKRPRFASRVLGFHEIFHLFVLAGSACHYLLVFKYVA